MNWKQYLASIVDGQRIVAVDGTPIPAPPHSEHPGDHLLVNCLYPDDVVRVNFREPLLEMAKADVVELLRRVVASRRLDDLVSVCVTIIGQIEVEGADRPARRRVYRYSILCSDLPDGAAQINDRFLSAAPGTLTGSEIDDIAQVLEHDRQMVERK